MNEEVTCRAEWRTDPSYGALRGISGMKRMNTVALCPTRELLTLRRSIPGCTGPGTPPPTFTITLFTTSHLSSTWIYIDDTPFQTGLQQITGYHDNLPTCKGVLERDTGMSALSGPTPGELALGVERIKRIQWKDFLLMFWNTSCF